MRDFTPCILMATCDGAAYIEEQLDSLAGQTHKNWVLLVRDDGSTDETPELLRRRAAGDERIRLLPSATTSAEGPAQNFGHLIAEGLQTRHNLFYLCDQDDIWESTKLSLLARHFPDLGEEATPVLAHSDLSVVDARSRPTHPSLQRLLKSNPLPDYPLIYLLTRNFVTGCAVACNRRLLEAASPVPDQAMMHDWWLALVAAAAGRINYTPEPLVRYRQHGGNAIGANSPGDLVAAVRAWPRNWRKGNRELRDTFAQAHALLDVAGTGDDYPEEALRAVQRYTELPRLSPGTRIAAARKLGLRRDSILLRWVLYLRLLTLPRDFIDRAA